MTECMGAMEIGVGVDGVSENYTLCGHIKIIQN